MKQAAVDAMKQAAAEAALEYVRPGMTVGVGTGSTAAFFVAALARRRDEILAAVASSEATAAALRAAGIAVVDLAAVGSVPLYVDGADEVDPALRLIKGGGGAHTREKAVATAAGLFVC
ncbi:MAG TPA: ribose-5-phosphate isomerase A, partial [Thermoleophilia bacterium]|nr:ribose-5-phosphate isomerase A [Thermoleophilia bacterium]